jgi:tetratricopeptide (TPR) repeat protein
MAKTLAVIWPVILIAITNGGSGLARAEDKGDKVATLVKRADELYDKRTGDKSTWKVVGFLRQAQKLAPNDFEVLWRLARAYFWLADNTTDEARDKSLGDKGYRYAMHAARLKPKRVEGHFWGAICIGEYSKGIGIITALRKGIEGKFVNSLKRAIKIDRRYGGGGGDRAYAMYYHELPWPKKDNDKALQHLRRSLKIMPHSARTHYYFALVLEDEGKKAEAKKHLKRCLAVNPKRWDPPDNYRFQWHCRRMLKKK